MRRDIVHKAEYDRRFGIDSIHLSESDVLFKFIDPWEHWLAAAVGFESGVYSRTKSYGSHASGLKLTLRASRPLR